MSRVACPFFLPIEKIADPQWNHPLRLPLGGGWTGQCTAPGHESTQPSADELRDHCNLGYARCGRLPQERRSDAVRFAVSRAGSDCIEVRYVCEAAHLPVENGTLAFELKAEQWSVAHPDPRIQRQAECYLESYRARRQR